MQYLLILLSVFAAVLPMAGFLALVWWLDRYDREPVWMVLLTFAWGAIGATSLSLLGNTTAHLGISVFFGPGTAGLISPVVVAPLVEEPTKAVILLVVLLSRHFDNATDGFVYGSAAGLGFGMTENFLYFTTVAGTAAWDPLGGTLAWLGTVVIRTCYSALMHATASALVGACLGWARTGSVPLKIFAGTSGLLMAVAIHALWNGLLTLDSQLDAPISLTALDFLLFPVELLTALALFQLCLWGERRTVRRELVAESRLGTLPEGHIEVLSSYLRRSFGRWAPPGVDQRAYVRVATTLALRRDQARRSKGGAQRRYEHDVERLRRELSGILAGAR